MKKQVQDVGERDWYGDHWLGIQDEGWKVMEGFLSQYATACVWSGCAVTVNGEDATKRDIAPGIVFMKDVDGVYQFAEFAGVTKVSLPGYVTLTKTPTNALYGDGNSKNIFITTSGSFSNAVPGAGVDYLQFTSAGATTWKTAAGLGQPVGAPEPWRNVGSAGQPPLIDATKVEIIDFLRFRKDSLGFVEVEGQVRIKSTVSASICALFNLPSTYRPAGIPAVVGVAAQNGDDGGGGDVHSVWVASGDGKVYIQPTHSIDSTGVIVYFYIMYRTQ